MRTVVGGVVVSLLLTAAARGGEAEPVTPPPQPHLMLFSGADLWSSGCFAHAGILWALDGLYRDGFVLKAFGGGGTYRYIADRFGTSGGIEVNAQQVMASLMPGWRFTHDKFELTLFAGLDWQQHRLTPDDPASRTRGEHLGARFGADVWYEPARAVMLAGGFSLSTIGTGYWARGATGVRLLDRIWIGPEALALGDTSYWQARTGLHLTALRTGMFEWSAGGGFARDSDGREGWYGRFGLLVRH
jgi:hypothetical protein